MVFAYLDPGSGSMVTQALVAGVAGAAVAAKIGWRRVASAKRKIKKEQPEPETQSVEE